MAINRDGIFFYMIIRLKIRSHHKYLGVQVPVSSMIFKLVKKSAFY
jgi:hypothetical protein